MPILLFWQRPQEEVEEPAIHWNCLDVFHVFCIVIHFALVWVLQGSFVVYFCIYHRHILLILPALSLCCYLIVYLGYLTRLRPLLFIYFLFEIPVALAYAVIGTLIIVEAQGYMSYGNIYESTFFPGVFPDQIQIVGIWCLICTVGQLLFLYVVWRGFKHHIGLLYWVSDCKTRKSLKWTLAAICIQICIASAVLAIVLSITNV